MKLNEYSLKDWDGKSITKMIEIKSLRVILLELDLTVMPPRKGRLNLIATNHENNIVWIAKLPGNEIYASYDDIKYDNGILNAWCGSYLCEIDPNSGSILSEKFIK
jgi:hypothetical protein